jgi:pimeloyl-ACP methyl ester carboxylesterase
MPHHPIRFGKQTLSTGITVRYAEQGDPDSPALLCLHGYTDSWFSFQRVFEQLPPALHAFALDQRGHGDSERPATGYTVADFAQDALAFMDAQGIAQATVVGHSMGSFIAQQVALLAPTRVTRLVLIGSATTAVNAGVVELQQAAHTLTDPVDRQFIYEFQASTIYAPVPESFLNRVVEESMKLPARVWQAAIDGLLASDLTAQLGWITAPTLVLWGDRDAIFSRSEQDALVAAIPAARLTVYPETGHALHWERPQEVAADLLQFTHTGG